MSYSDQINDMRGELRMIGKTIPKTMGGFGELSKAVKDNGVLGLKEKEMIALGMAVVLHCEPCIMFHVEALMQSGASREELADVLSMAIQMGGGPGLMYAGHALACWDELAAAAK
ncbi:MAG: carboxymuconolactone decarboxylase family protein [Rhodobacteraceae bacterium]|nr:carboxymuconolactone decarboxylase family protein [Paracoccaceae bacterium]